MHNAGKTIAGWLTRALWVLETGLFLGLTLLNLRYIAFNRPSSAVQELIEFQNDSVLRFLPVFLLGVAAAALLRKLLQNRYPTTRVCLIVLAVIVGALSLWWALNSGYVLKGDQDSVVQTARRMLAGDYSDFEPGAYLFIFPFQIGFTTLLELLFTLFGTESLLPFTLLNWAGNIGSYLLLWGIGRQLFFRDETADRGPERLAATLMLSLCLVGSLRINFVYGNLLGNFLGLLAVWLLLRWQQAGGWGRFAGGCLAMAGAIQLKLFNAIFLVALVIFLVLNALLRQKPQTLLLPVLLVLACVLGQSAVSRIYEAQAGQPLPKSYPMELTIAMGMQDNWEGWRAPGWCNAYNFDTYREVGYDRELAVQKARQDIAARLQQFRAEPKTALQFYKLKTLSQWTEPTYQGFWLEYDFFHPDKYSPFMDNLYNGPLQDALVRGMKWYQTAVWLLAFLCLASRYKSVQLGQLLPGLIILGGFLFSLLSEGKGQYILPYFLLAVPYAGAGLAWLLKQADRALASSSFSSGRSVSISSSVLHPPRQ